MTLILHYAPDNASLCVRLALELAGLPYRTALVDRRAGMQRAPAYLALNPNGLIPVLETQDGPLFETAAILLWLADRLGGLAPAPGDADRGLVLKWLFWLSNSLHATERMLFYPGQYTDTAGGPALTARTCARLIEQVSLLEAALPDLAGWVGADRPSILDCYLAPLLRWPALYAPGAQRGWYDLARWPGLFAAMTRFETAPAMQAAARAEGLGPQPVTAPRYPHPPEGQPQ